MTRTTKSHHRHIPTRHRRRRRRDLTTGLIGVLVLTAGLLWTTDGLLNTYGYYDLPTTITDFASIETASWVFGGAVLLSGLLAWSRCLFIVRRLRDGAFAFRDN